MSQTKAMPIDCTNLLSRRGTKRQIAAMCCAVLALVVLALSISRSSITTTTRPACTTKTVLWSGWPRAPPASRSRTRWTRPGP